MRGLFASWVKSKDNRQVKVIRRSAFFDEAWYLEKYPDVASAGVDAAVHYFMHGASEGRNPGPRFSTNTYILQIPVSSIGSENPLVHFEKHATAAQRAKPPMSEDFLVRPGHDRALNAQEARKNRGLVAASERTLNEFMSKLPDPADYDGNGKVPKVFHFIYGFHSAGDLPYFGYIAIRSALAFNPGWSAFYYCMHEPEGPNWDQIKDHVTVIKLDDFDYFMSARFYHYAHKADIIRMIVINHVGGVYLDLDTITRKSFEDLRDAQFCMGVQAAGSASASGLCNAVMIGQPNAVFSTEWLSKYDYFRSRGRDSLWDYHSVKLPSILMSRNPDTIRVLDYRAFFYPLWMTIEQQLFTERGYDLFKDSFYSAYCFHLWNGGTGHFLDELNEETIMESRTIYADIARRALETRL